MTTAHSKTSCGRARRLIVGVLAMILVTGGAVIWLERSVPVAQIVRIQHPGKSELVAVSRARVLFGHQSIGSNILGGIGPLYVGAGMKAPTITDARILTEASDGTFSHAHLGVNGDPRRKFSDFTAIMDGPLGAALDVALMKLCYVDIVASTDVEAVFSAYVQMMDELEEQHPNVRFLYATAPLNTDRSWKASLKSWVGIDDHMGPADNVARDRYNMLIRQRYGSSGRLFDIAAIEARGSDPRNLNGTAYPVLNQTLSSDAGHLNEHGSQVVAAELIALIAANVD